MVPVILLRFTTINFNVDLFFYCNGLARFRVTLGPHSYDDFPVGQLFYALERM